jgi:hypothetical protein
MKTETMLTVNKACLGINGALVVFNALAGAYFLIPINLLAMYFCYTAIKQNQQ